MGHVGFKSSQKCTTLGTAKDEFRIFAEYVGPDSGV